MDQGQHRIPEVYLKKFGYLNNSKWYITYLDKRNGKIRNEEINKYSKSLNEFDFPFDNIQDKRLLESNFAKIENLYNTSLNILENQGKIIEKYKEQLVHFVSRLICGSELNRYYFERLYLTSETKVNFLNEITMFEDEEKEEIIKLTSLLKPLDIEYINAITWLLMNFLTKVLRSFQMVFLRTSSYKYWSTSDNPVIINKQGNYNWIIPIESEITLPLSKEICLFMFHEKSEIETNPLRKLSVDNVHPVSDGIYENLLEEIYKFHSNHIILPYSYEDGDIMGKE